MEFVIISGMSGAGKSRAASFMEDMGYFCVDNLPVPLIPKVAALSMAGAEEYDRVVVVTNQSGIARGMYGEPEMHSVHAKIRELLAPSGADFDAIYFCPHPPAAECCCRKPKPGMLLKAVEDLGIDPAISFMVGDRAGDIEAGISAGCKATYLVRSGYGEETLKKGTPAGAIVVNDLLAAVKNFFKD